jgi:hypothetical protein
MQMLSPDGLSFLGAFAKLGKVTVSFIMSVYPSLSTSCLHRTAQLPVDRFSLNLIFGYSSKVCRENSSFIETWQEYFTEDQYTFSIICHSILLRMRNVSDKFLEQIKTHILCSLTFFLNRAVYEITWKNIVMPETLRVTIQCLQIAWWITIDTCS